MKLAVFVDQVFWHDGQVYSTDEAYVLFPLSFSEVFEEVVFIGRLAPEPGRRHYVVSSAKTSFLALPWYRDLRDFWRQGARLPAQIRALVRKECQDWGAVWIGGPSLAAIVIAQEAIAGRRPVFFVVRQNLPQQVSKAYEGVSRWLATVMAHWLEWRFRRLVRGRNAFCVGAALTAIYQHAGARAHPHFVTLMRKPDVLAQRYSPSVREAGRLLCVGRLAGEKGQQIALEALSCCLRAGCRCRLDVVGIGPDGDRLRQLCKKLGLESAVRFLGYVPFGQELFQLYRKSSILVVPSLSEGLPQVIFEALATGTPIVASSVGGIPAFLQDRQTAMLVRPGNTAELARAVVALLDSPESQERLRSRGWDLISRHTLEAQRDYVTQIIFDEVLDEENEHQPTELSSRAPSQPAQRAGLGRDTPG